MPKITAGGGATNAREALETTGPSSAPAAAPDGPTVELTRGEDPHAPAARPGEHVTFFAEHGERPDDSEPGEPLGEQETPDAPDEGAETSQEVEDSAVPARPVKAAKKAPGGGRR